jgi:hypothetical protein
MLHIQNLSSRVGTTGHLEADIPSELILTPPQGNSKKAKIEI